MTVGVESSAFHPDCMKRKVKFTASVMVWGSMSEKGVGRLYFIDCIVNTDKYLTIINECLLLTMEETLNSGDDLLFQQDGTTCHTSKTALKWFKDNNIPLLEWVSSSPDLSPKETMA